MGRKIRKKINILLSFSTFIILIILFNLNLSFAKNCGSDIVCNCGDTLISNYIMTESLICEESNAINLNNGILDCNKNSIIGINQSFTALIINGGDNIQIKNCNILNFQNGLTINKRRYRTGNGWGANWYDYDITINTKVTNSNFENNSIGIYTTGTNDLIHSNTFKNNLKYALYLNSASSKVYNNRIYNTSIFYTSTRGKTFCNENIGNFYFNTTGPNCNCIDLFDNLLINSKVRICPKDYLLNTPLKMDINSNLNCNGANIINNGSNTAINIAGKRNVIINNCNFYNFSTAINSYIYYYKDYRGINTANYPNKISILKRQCPKIYK